MTAKPLLRDTLATLSLAVSADDLERLFQIAISEHGSHFAHVAIDKAMRKAGRRLIAESGRETLIPELLPRRKLRIGAVSCSVGYGGNSTGERYVWHYAKEWALERLAEKGLDSDTAAAVWEWFDSFPHRALQAVAEAMPPPPPTGKGA